MALIDSAVDGLFGAIVSGGVAFGIFWWTGKGRKHQLEDAWRRQADELDERLSKQYEGQISWLRKQLDACQIEGRRLNDALNKRRRDGND